MIRLTYTMRSYEHVKRVGSHAFSHVGSHAFSHVFCADSNPAGVFLAGWDWFLSRRGRKRKEEERIEEDRDAQKFIGAGKYKMCIIILQAI